MTPAIAVHMPVHNRRDFLGEAIDSVLAQSRDDFELLVWDDGSTDGSLELAREYQRRDRRVRVVAGEHAGIAGAPKRAIEHTDAPYLCIVDSDDLITPAALAETTAVLDAHDEVGVVYTDYCDIDTTGRVLCRGKRCRIDYSPNRLLIDFMMFHLRLVRRSVYEAVGGIDTDPAVAGAYDYDLVLKLSETTTVARVRQPMYFYRHHPQAMSVAGRDRQRDASASAVRRALHRRGLDKTHELIVHPNGKFQIKRRPVNDR